MEQRVGKAAGLAAFFIFLVLGIFEVQEWKMPDQIAVILIVVMGTMAMVAIIVVMHGIWGWSKPMRNRYGLQTPIYTHKANPYQSLIDISKVQWANPTTHLVVTDRILMGVYLDKKLPYVQVRVCFANFGLNEVTISQPYGHPWVGKEESPYGLKDEGGRSTVPPGNTATSFNLDIYIPHELLEEVRQEVGSPSGEIRSIDLSQVRAMVQAKGEGAPMAIWSFGTGREIFRPNRAIR